MESIGICYLQMNTSGGGGFCDCGDPEAWKDGVACDTHQHTGNADMEEVWTVMFFYNFAKFVIYILILHVHCIEQSKCVCIKCKMKIEHSIV